MVTPIESVALLGLLAELTELATGFASTAARVRVVEAFAVELVRATSRDPQLEPAVRHAVDRAFDRYLAYSEQVPDSLLASVDEGALDTLNALRSALARSPY